MTENIDFDDFLFGGNDDNTENTTDNKQVVAKPNNGINTQQTQNNDLIKQKLLNHKHSRTTTLTSKHKQHPVTNQKQQSKQINKKTVTN